jgi:hypothetical protein
VRAARHPRTSLAGQSRSRVTRLRVAAVLGLVAAMSGLATGQTPQARSSPPPSSGPTTGKGAAPGTTGCAACHVQTSWSAVQFDHDRTGYPLVEAHAKVTCQACHPHGFRTQVSQTCAGCHRDRHAGEFGLHCEGCHDETRWASTLFGPDAHRTTSFPLTGQHAAIPCRECHGEMRDRTFSQTPLTCVACHQRDYTQAGLTSVDHLASHFDTNCQGCHNTWSFSPARFDAHELCFALSSGPHHPIRCAQCHTRLAGLAAVGTCNTQTFTCASCHEHACARSDQVHLSVMGYNCSDSKCYQCHLRSVP